MSDENLPAEVAEQREEIVCFDPWDDEEPGPAAPAFPPPEIAELIDLFSLKNLAEANLPTLNDPPAAWLELVDRIDIFDVEEFDLRSAPPCGLARALLSLPDAARHDFGRRHPHEIARIAGLAMHWLYEAGIPDADVYGVVEELLAPDLLATLKWLAGNRMASFAEALGYGSLIN